MPEYTVREATSGKTVTFKWNGSAPPTDADLADVFAAAGQTRAPATAPPVQAPADASPYAPDKMRAAAKSVQNFGIRALPAVGGFVGGAVGAVGGPAGAIGGAALGGGAGEAFRQLAERLRGNPAPSTPGAAASAIGVQGAVQGGAEGIGQAIKAGLQAAGPYLMQKALKPTQSMLENYRTSAPKVVQTLLNEGVSVTANGVDKLQRLLKATNDDIGAAVANATGTINKRGVAARLLETAGRAAKQVNPEADLQAIGEVGQQFLDHPVYQGSTLTVPEAQAMKVGTYATIGKKYGEISSAAVEAQKALARGLKEDIAAEVPGLAGLNSRDSELMAALDAVGRRVALSGNKDPVGFAWVAQHPTTFLAALIDRNPAVKSMVARGAYQLAGTAGQVAPQLIRAAVLALTTHGSAPSPAPALSGSGGSPARR